MGTEYGVLADMTGDGFANLVVRAGRTAELADSFSGGPKSLVPTPVLQTSLAALDPGLEFVATGDVRGLAAEDLIAAVRDAYVVFPSDLSAPPVTVSTPTHLGHVVNVLSVGDIDGDGVEDVAWSVDGLSAVDFGPLKAAGPCARTTLP